jgi:hypothetical protein
MADFARVNDVYAEYCPEARRPASRSSRGAAARADMEIDVVLATP